MRIFEIIEGSDGRYSSKRVLAVICAMCVVAIVIRYLFTDKVDVALVATLLSSAGMYLGITGWDRFQSRKEKKDLKDYGHEEGI